MPAPRTVWKKGARASARLGELAGAGLKLLGFNTILAPLLDLSRSKSEPGLETRTVSGNPQDVTQWAESFIRGLRRQKILPCGKHFPGLGSAGAGAQSELPLSGKTMAELWREDLVPYRELLPQLPLVMVGHAAYKAYDFDLPRPAMLSANVVEGLLRVKLGYRGVRVAGHLDRKEVCAGLEPGEAAVRSFNAGCDLLLVGSEEKSVAECVARLKQAVDSGRIPAWRLEQALERIRGAKKGLARPGDKVLRSACSKLARQFEDFSKECPREEEKIA